MTPTKPINHHLVVLRGRVDAHFDAAIARTPDGFECAPGCDQCCQAGLSVFAVEAEPIRQALVELGRTQPELREQIRRQGLDPDHDACALLVAGRCSVYAQRPLICRSHGLPIAVPANPDDPADPAAPLVVDHCPLNFQTLAPPRASVLVLDAINRPLAMLAELASPGADRVALAELAADENS